MTCAKYANASTGASLRRLDKLQASQIQTVASVCEIQSFAFSIFLAYKRIFYVQKVLDSTKTVIRIRAIGEVAPNIKHANCMVCLG